jgi:hypothetical protein
VFTGRVPRAGKQREAETNASKPESNGGLRLAAPAMRRIAASIRRHLTNPHDAGEAMDTVAV